MSKQIGSQFRETLKESGYKLVARRLLNKLSGGSTTMNELVKKLDARKLGYSPKMAAIMGAIIGHDYGVRDPHVATLATELHSTVLKYQEALWQMQ